MPHYHVAIDDLHSHHFRVTLTVPQPAAQQELALPVWINGSYMVREFGRHLSALEARQGRRAVPLRQLDKTRWLADCSGRAALVVQYRVYAFDTSVRAAFLDDRRGFFNGTSLCLRVVGQEAAPHRLHLGRLPADWEAATAMAPAADGTPLAFDAASYDELVDHPVELGSFWRGSFTAGGVPHHIVVAGALPGFDGDRLLADAQRICSAQIAFWHGQDGGAPPFGHYLFLLNAVDDGYGGLEHRASTALIAARRDLPRRGMDGIPDGYLTLLGLISHEYFHTWNVKRLMPADLARVDWQRENHTELLWFFEGFTSYYDELMLLRCGLIDAPRYLRLLAKTVNAVAATPGRQVQSVAAASFDAWVKYYRTDENTPNATVSYYLKGALVALCLDLTLRQRGRSLDAVLQGLWQRSGGGPITEGDIADVLADVAGRRLDAELQAWVHGTGELPVAELLTAIGVHSQPERAGLAASLGLRLSEGPVSGVQVKSVLAGGAAVAAGLSAGDELLAID
ncbi:M61 family metallopeptidase, partial [Pseudaquabacterium pictum]|uniref:M61 family metallopeptidase n=1 Tax=Pseudaquabacterium pictum TaxID=2315236 RepID=UPI0010F9424C